MNIISKWLSSETVKKSACRYALQRYLGQFWEGNLELEQLTVDLLNGMCRVSDITLRVEALNEHAQQYDLPLEFIDGSIGNLSLSVPWSTDGSESSYVEVSGLRITIQPRQRTDPSTSTFESMWNSMTASIEADKENVEQEPGDCNPVDGVRIFTRVIDSMIASFKVRFINTVIRLEHVPLESTNGVALEMCVDRFEYVDDASSAPSDLSDLASDEDKAEKAFLGTAFGSKKIYMEGVSFNVDEFPSSARTFCKSVITSRCSTPESGASSTETMHTPPDNDFSHLGSSNPMMVAKITGRQEIRLKHKQNADAQGPRFEVDVSLGSFILFLTPRQVHILTELSRGLAEPETEDISNVPPRSYKEKPLLNIDYSRIEQELMQHLNPPPIRSADLRNIHGWSTGSADESDNEEEFHPMRRPGMTDSIASTSLTLDESFCSSSTRSGYTNTRRSRKHKTSVDSDPSEEISQLSLRISSVAISVLHEDILTLGVETEGPTLTSINQLRKMAEAFFDAIGVFAMDYGNKNFEGALQTFQNAVKVSHIRFLAAPLVIDTMVKETNDGRMISGNLTLASVDIAECLIDDTDVECPKTDFVELLKFVVCDDDSFTRTDFRMRFKHTQKAVRHAQVTKYTHPRTEVNMTIEPCRSEFDITMVDRISALLNPAPICIRNPFSTVRNPWDEQTPERLIDQAVESPMATASVLDIKMSCPKIALKIRFPVPDLRPLHDIDRAPWWVRSVRPDFASLILTEAQVHTSIDGRSAFDSRTEIQCRDMFMTYTEADGESTIEFARSHVDERPDEYVDRESQFGWPRIVIALHPQVVGGPLESDSEEDGPTSLEEALAEPPYDPSPFSSSRMVHESDTPHSQSQDKEGEELIIPGNREEMAEFITYGTRGAKVQLEILLPCLSVQIPSKHLYEEIYNRFNTDLLLWRPSAPKPTHRGQDAPLSLNLNPGQLQGSIHPKFSMCKSGIQGDSDGDSDDDIFVSTANKSFHQKTTVKKEKKKDGPSQLALTLTIPQGVLSMYTPVRDAMSNVIPGQQGELIFRVEDATVFCITSYKGDPNLGYVSTMIKDVSLSHCGMITMPSTIPPLRSIHSVTPAYCKPTIYRSELGLEDTNSDMLSVAVRIQGAHDTHHIKTFRVSLGLRNATLRHRVYATPTSWHAQLMDCFDVLDHPVAGYSPPGVLTELHLHLYDSAIDYRPLFLPYRTMLTLGSFSVSSNIAAKTNTSTLRFLAENLGLFVSEKIGNFVDLRRDYICLMDMSLFELSLRLNDKMCGGEPKYDLRVSNNILNIRTCSDSGRVLTQLLSYFANDGDLGMNDLSSDSFGIPTSAEGSLFDDESVPDHITKSREEVLTNLMEDAMIDTVRKFMPNAELRKKKEEPDADVFCFPDESHPASMTSEMSNSPTAPKDSDDDTDDEFCIIGEDAGTGIVPRSGIPEVRWLTQDTIRVHENHFAIPVGKTDPLKAPKNFPNAVTRYTICEMSIIWHIYGGRDFGNPAIIKKRVTIDDSYSRSRPSSAASSRLSSHDLRSNSTQNSPRHSKPNNNDLNTKGGPNRKTDVLMELQMSKIRFQHEAYPDDTAAAARQVLLIQDIEIRDKLEVSDINKFLYQYNCEAMPKQTHANMLVIRANHMRPDPRSAAQECSVKVSLLPIRLNVDQDSLLFLIEFFTDLAADGGITLETPQPGAGPSSWPGSKQGTPTHQPPVFSTNYDSDDEDIDSIHENIMRNAQTDENLLFFSEDEPTIRENKRKPKRSVSSQDGSQPTYFRSIVFGPEVLIKIDYHGKRLDLTHGSFTGVLMALGQLSNSELKLKRLVYRHGILGFDKLISYMLSEWMQDIKKNQLPGILGGVGPLSSLLQLFQGIKDLIWMPIEQYQKDGRIVRGLQRGANSFSTSTAMAILELTSRMVNIVQTTAETTYDMVSPGPTIRIRGRGPRGRRTYNHPQDIREGVANACMVVREGLGETAAQLVRVASEEHEQKGVSGAVGGILFSIPKTVILPIVVATEATSNVIGGVVSSIQPDARREAVQKWRKQTDDNK